MDLVFRLARRITVLVQGASWSRARRRDRRRSAGARSLSRRAGAPMTDARRPASSKASSAGYGETVVLEGIDLELPPGGTLAVLGRNGVGKTTLLATIMGQTPLRAGSIRFAGREIAGAAGLSPRPARHRLRAAGARDLPVADGRGKSPGARRARGDGRSSRSSISFRALAERRRNRGNQLSGGEQQMLAIGRALIGNPSLLLMDEPLEGLAPVIVDALLAGLDRLKRDGRSGAAPGRAARPARARIDRPGDRPRPRRHRLLRPEPRAARRSVSKR